jgi:adenylate cyclase class 1
MAALYINDEKGAFFNYYTQFHNAQALLQPLYRFLNNIRKRQNYSQLEDGKHLYFYEIVFNKKIHRYIIDPIPTDMDVKDEHHFEVEALAHSSETQHIVYDIICNKKTFSYAEHGDNIYRDVALHVLGQRQSKQHYPIYLTDIDLSQCHSSLYLQTIVYIQHKQKIERLLNHAMQDIE